MNVYCVARLGSPLVEPMAVPDGIEVRPISPSDLDALARLYAKAYDLPTDELEGATTEMRSAFEGTWGELWPEASPVAWLGDDPIAVVQTVRRPAMADAPACPWLIEVFTDPRHRRTSMARTLVRTAFRVIAETGEHRVGLTVDTDNHAARTLYRSLGFVELP